MTAVASRSHRDPETDAYLGLYPVAELRPAGSSLKFCVVAEGGADLYPRLGPTMEWDTAAGDAVLRAAGGSTMTLQGQPLRYGNVNGMPRAFENPSFVALGGVEHKFVENFLHAVGRPDLIAALMFVTLALVLAWGAWQVFSVRRSQKRRGIDPDSPEAVPQPGSLDEHSRTRQR